MARILIIRGGAIGDFILTLPAIGLVREAFPEAEIEILGYKHIIALAEGRHYAHATRSIEYAGLSSFFIPGAELSEDLVCYFSDFDQVISYLYDPDGFFEANLYRAGVENFVSAYSRIVETPEAPHAVRQLAEPLGRLALFLDDDRSAEQPRLLPSADDRAAAEKFLGKALESGSVLAVHPGSGGKYKLWPLDYWQKLLETLRNHQDGTARRSILLIGGEADAERIEALQAPGDLLAWNLSLPHLAAILERCSVFLGHDSGISHIAAAVGTPCVLLFGPTNPAIWAPTGDHVQVLHADLPQILPETVLSTLNLLQNRDKSVCP